MNPVISQVLLPQTTFSKQIFNPDQSDEQVLRYIWLCLSETLNNRVKSDHPYHFVPIKVLSTDAHADNGLHYHYAVLLGESLAKKEEVKDIQDVCEECRLPENPKRVIYHFEVLERPWEDLINCKATKIRNVDGWEEGWQLLTEFRQADRPMRTRASPEQIISEVWHVMYDEDRDEADWDESPYHWTPFMVLSALSSGQGRIYEVLVGETEARKEDFPIEELRSRAPKPRDGGERALYAFHYEQEEKTEPAGCWFKRIRLVDPDENFEL